MYYNGQLSIQGKLGMRNGIIFPELLTLSRAPQFFTKLCTTMVNFDFLCCPKHFKYLLKCVLRWSTFNPRRAGIRNVTVLPELLMPSRAPQFFTKMCTTMVNFQSKAGWDPTWDVFPELLMSSRSLQFFTKMCTTMVNFQSQAGWDPTWDLFLNF